MSGCFSHGNIMGLSIVISHHKNWDNTGISTIFNGNHRKTRKENWGFKGFTSRDLPSGNLLYSELEKKNTMFQLGKLTISMVIVQQLYEITRGYTIYGISLWDCVSQHSVGDIWSTCMGFLNVGDLTGFDIVKGVGDLYGIYGI